jgi:hypothetical protein
MRMVCGNGVCWSMEERSRGSYDTDVVDAECKSSLYLMKDNQDYHHMPPSNAEEFVTCTLCTPL